MYSPLSRDFDCEMRGAESDASALLMAKLFDNLMLWCFSR